LFLLAHLAGFAVQIVFYPDFKRTLQFLTQTVHGSDPLRLLPPFLQRHIYN
jgi:hypothetical protein